MTFRVPLVAAAVVASAVLLPLDASRAGEAAKHKSRADNDVRVQMKIHGKRKAQLRVDVKVKNRGRLDQSNLEVVLHDGDAATPLWSDVITLDAGQRKKFRVQLDRAAVGDELTVECHGTHDEDDANPDDNTDTEPVSPGQPTPGTPGAATAAQRGRDLYVPLCSGCHGPDGRGGTVDENIAREPWDELVEAFREGEDGMPRFDLSSSDARDIVAYLRDPTAVEPTPTEPPPTGTVPTYTAHVKPILDTNCVACHGSAVANAGIMLHNYNRASQNAAAALAAIEAGRMPPSGPLSATDIATIRDWIDGGKPQ